MFFLEMWIKFSLVLMKVILKLEIVMHLFQMLKFLCSLQSVCVVAGTRMTCLSEFQHQPLN
jgi:hypothetical protein